MGGIARTRKRNKGRRGRGEVRGKEKGVRGKR